MLTSSLWKYFIKLKKRKRKTEKKTIQHSIPILWSACISFPKHKFQLTQAFPACSLDVWHTAILCRHSQFAPNLNIRLKQFPWQMQHGQQKKTTTTAPHSSEQVMVNKKKLAQHTAPQPTSQPNRARFPVKTVGNGNSPWKPHPSILSKTGWQEGTQGIREVCCALGGCFVKTHTSLQCFSRWPARRKHEKGADKVSVWWLLSYWDQQKKCNQRALIGG